MKQQTRILAFVTLTAIVAAGSTVYAAGEARQPGSNVRARPAWPLPTPLPWTRAPGSCSGTPGSTRSTA